MISLNNLIFNSIEAFDNFIINFKNNIFSTKILQNKFFVFVPIYIKVLDSQKQ
jgi:hypothetical protein